jgi:hypothetical protein
MDGVFKLADRISVMVDGRDRDGRLRLDPQQRQGPASISAENEGCD